MNKSGILNALPNLSATEGREILEKLLDLEAEGWLNAADLTDEERRLIESVSKPIDEILTRQSHGKPSKRDTEGNAVGLWESQRKGS